MAEKSSIEWTDATYNPWHGCTKVSAACDFCYAETFSRRVGFSETGSQFPIWGKDSPRRFFGDKHWAEPLKWNASAEREGVRKRVFCGSMCDVMEDYNGTGHLVKETIQESRRWLYRVIERTPNLDWLLLTKRPQNFRRFLPESWLNNPRPNVWGMTTVESREYLWRIDALRETPFVIRGLSVEPLLADIGTINLTGISWVIVGGESGHGARPMHPDWARSLRDQCNAAGVAFLFKQHGNWIEFYDRDRDDPDWRKCPKCDKPSERYINLVGGHGFHGERVVAMRNVGKKAAGRLLDGRTWDELPLSTRNARD